ncbi:hypothetical protein OG440_36775 [Streptomyces sp. NBC_00637]
MTTTPGTSQDSRARGRADHRRITAHPTAPMVTPRTVKVTYGPGWRGSKSSEAPAARETTAISASAMIAATVPAISHPAAAARRGTERRDGAGAGVAEEGVVGMGRVLR